MNQSLFSKYLLFAIFAVSGFSGLIYESIWSHYLKLFLGHAAYAQTLVLAIFMGGMALGSWVIARRSQRWRNLLLVYVAVEGIIGLFGLVFHQGFVASTDIIFSHAIPALGASAWVPFVKWSVASLLILPQSILLGMTFPLMSGGILRRFSDRPGATVSMLYFTNSLGAAIGVLVSGFALIPTVGLPGTIMTAGILNVLLALVVWLIIRSAPEPMPVPQPLIAAPDQRTLTTFAVWILLAAFLSGVASFLYEIAWIRMLSLVLGSSTHAFELMLSAFILGLALGGLWISRRADNLLDPQRFLGVTMIIMGSLAAATIILYGHSFDWMAQALRALNRNDQGYAAFNLISHAIAAVIMLPATFCAGITLPLMTHVLLKARYGERAIGQVYAVNTLGAIIGVMVAIHLLMPVVGVKGVVLTGAVLHMMAGLAFLVRSAKGASHPRTVSTALAWSVAWIAIMSMVELDPKRMAAGVFRTGLAQLAAEAEVTFHRDGKTATVSLLKTKDGKIGILTNGKADAAINMAGGPPAGDEITMTLAGTLPLGLHPRPQRVANIGIGSGLTSHILLTTDQVIDLDTVEIEPLMASAARQGFMPRVRNLFEDPRSHIHFEDAKTFFATRQGQYDVIVSEPSNPWVSGVATLFSDEFYQRVTQYLKADGIFVQWLQTYETDMSVVASVMNALSKHFSDYVIYDSDTSDMIVVAVREGSIGPLRETVFDAPALAAALARVGLHSMGDIEHRRIGRKALIDPLFRSFPVPINSDYFPFVDYTSPRMRFLNRNAGALMTIRSVPIPLLQVLEHGQIAEFDRQRPQAQTALAIRNAVIDGRLEGLGAGIEAAALLLDLDEARCSDAAVRTTWLDAAYTLFLATSPYLPPEAATSLWSRIEATPCYQHLDDRQHRPIALWKATAMRDAPSMAASGRALLERGGVLTRPEQLRLAVGITMLGYLGQKQQTGAQAIWDAYGKDAPKAASYELVLQWLRALSDWQLDSFTPSAVEAMTSEN
ncbi:spermidine synthase [Thiorhodococcus mannitoliphagus]|uniref:Spermidine synthase n=1 Tax=Thiorhodococcus mannitoliphagus TaxID=329406 RepID=A0A6P1E4Z1_9GAMM|nr:fused MFS/spermidine synthase [Thiorhodococcus mannitoliphagus]NEX23094.1 spermidine synthase [Thiorhodococcus mannitoliphagus]